MTKNHYNPNLDIGNTFSNVTPLEFEEIRILQVKKKNQIPTLKISQSIEPKILKRNRRSLTKNINQMEQCEKSIESLFDKHKLTTVRGDGLQSMSTTLN